MVAPLHTYIHALADVFKRPDLPMALPKSTLAPTNIVGNDAVKVLLFYNSVTLSSLVMSMNDDHAYIGIFIVLPLCDGWGEPPFPRLICLIPEPAPTAYMFVYLF